MNTPIIWKYDDVENDILAVEYNNEMIGYFRIDRDEFVIITDLIEGPRIPIHVLRTIVKEYDFAVSEAKKIVQTALSE